MDNHLPVQRWTTADLMRTVFALRTQGCIQMSVPLFVYLASCLLAARRATAPVHEAAAVVFKPAFSSTHRSGVVVRLSVLSAPRSARRTGFGCSRCHEHLRTAV